MRRGHEHSACGHPSRRRFAMASYPLPQRERGRRASLIHVVIARSTCDEAIQLFLVALDCFASLAMTARCTSAFSRHGFCPSLTISFAPSQARGRREDRVHAAPAVSCALMHRKCTHEHTGEAETLRPSLRNGFTTYFALSLVTGLSCHHRPCEALASQGLDASVGASGPHDFAVRAPRATSSRNSRPSLPASNVS